MKFIQISSMPVDENITLKRNFKLKVKPPQPKSQVENITIKKKLKLIKGERVDPLKVKRGRGKDLKRNNEKKARIDAHVKVQAKEEVALKLLRQRQVARLALEEMEKSVDVYDSFAIMKDLEMMGVAKCIGHDRVLEGLGLYLKNEFPEDDGDDVEEGEIIC
ncbi:hypothetical protein Scep_027297 [Stephania cephalantha]|uniref:Uncharacterized protein n=1 Tax=Stephania cephalantha TaxID=152367 RepID=A0AAP0HMF4_9MAGN